VIIGLSWPRPLEDLAQVPTAPRDLAAAEDIVLSRCSMCHAAEPLWPGIAAAPKGIELDTADKVRRHVDQIYLQSILTRAMPPGNITELPDEERAVLAAWIRAERSAAGR
jgi:uncharacterized membrane protein